MSTNILEVKVTSIFRVEETSMKQIAGFLGLLFDTGDGGAIFL
jgi:hypothetical protein